MKDSVRGFTILTAARIDESGRSWIEVMPAVSEDRNGDSFFTITGDDLQAVASYITAHPDTIPVDRDHAGARDSGSTRAAGWFTGQSEVIPAQGQNRNGETQDHASVWAEVAWTARAVQEIRDGEFRFISPEWRFGARDKKSGLLTKVSELLAATLTNRPHFRQLAPVTASELLDNDQVEAVSAKYGNEVAALLLASEDRDKIEAVLATIELPPNNTNENGDPVAEKQKDYSVIAETVGLDQDADEEKVLARLKEIADENATLKADAKTKPDESELAKVKAQADAATAELRTMKITGIYEGGVRDKKILPAERESLLAVAEKIGPEDFAAMIAGRPEHAYKTSATGADGGSEDEGTPAGEVKIQGTAYPVSDESHKLDVAARKILADAGKLKPTEAEYLAAVEQAESAVGF